MWILGSLGRTLRWTILRVVSLCVIVHVRRTRLPLNQPARSADLKKFLAVMIMPRSPISRMTIFMIRGDCEEFITSFGKTTTINYTANARITRD